MKARPFLPLAAAVLITVAIGIATTEPSNAALSPVPGGHCGGKSSFRWPVKTGADADAGSVNTTPQVESVAYLMGVDPPTEADLTSTNATNHRLNSFEFSTWQTTATVTRIHLNLHDSDLDVWLLDSAGDKFHAEAPWPGCVSSASPFLAQITAVRNYLDQAYPTSATQQTARVKRPATITGLGYFDHEEKAGSVTYYHTELHPLTDVVFTP